MTGRERQAAVDMTRGSPVKLILRFTLPLLIGQMMQQIYTLTDTMITGHFIGDAAIAAIGASTSLNDLMINFANGMCNGCGIIIGQLYGAQKMDKLRRATAVMLMFGVGLRALLTLGVMIGIEPLMRLLNTPESVFDEAMRYAAVVCGGVGVTILYNMCASFMRSLGNGRMPLVFLTISCVLNIALDTLFVVVLHIGVGALIAITAPFIPLIYNTTPEVQRLTTELLLVSGAALPIQAFAHVTYFTIRSGGKTFITFLFDCVFTWLIPLPIAFLRWAGQVVRAMAPSQPNGKRRPTRPTNNLSRRKSKCRKRSSAKKWA